MWQDDYISKRDNEYVCWDAKGEFITIEKDIDSARETITNYAKRVSEKNERTIQQLDGVSK